LKQSATGPTTRLDVPPPRAAPGGTCDPWRQSN